MKILRALAVLCMPFALMAGQNTITLKDGRTFSGRFIDGNTVTVAFQDDHGRDYRFRTSEVDRISFTGFNDRPNPSYDRPRADGNQVYSEPNIRRNGYSGTRVLPVGAEISVRTTTTINSRNAGEGETFSASVERDVLDGAGDVVIPRGSPAELIVRDINGGNSRNSNDLILDVQAVSVDGQRFLIYTEDLAQGGSGRRGLGANRRTGEFVGGGTALGTLLGAVAGGGKGALIGALAGAAAGVGTQVLTRGREVRVPSESVLNFRLDQPVYMNLR